MKFTETRLPGVYLIDIKPLEDERGFFARTFSRELFLQNGLNPCVEQCSVSYNRLKGTLRGMHYQVPPYSETKLVGCRRGKIYDVVLDIRETSPTYLQWVSAELSAENHRMFYIPEGFAHGFQTLEPDSEVTYQISASYQPDAARGVRFDDPATAMEWPLPVAMISQRDLGWRLPDEVALSR